MSLVALSVAGGNVSTGALVSFKAAALKKSPHVETLALGYPVLQGLFIARCIHTAHEGRRDSSLRLCEPSLSDITGCTQKHQYFNESIVIYYRALGHFGARARVDMDALIR